jgi:hypothetical protein
MKDKIDPHKPRVNRRKFIKLAGYFTSGTYLAGLTSIFARNGSEYRSLSGGSTEQPSSLRLATFRADVTPPIGSVLCGGLVKPVEGITDPLLALGVVILGAGSPIVLCAVDWCEIHNSDHVLWREQLALAAGTTPDRVTVHSLHQHNAPLADSVANKIMEESPLPIRIYDSEWGLSAIKGVADSILKALKKTKPFTHVAHGETKVSNVASNRRVMGDDGKVAFVRTSATKDPKIREMPEGIIDPMLKTVSFWNGTEKLVSIHYYATHPMSYYGDGFVTSDFVGIAREQCTREENVLHIYFSGCSGNITAGKYNDGDKANRLVLTERIHNAMIESEKNTEHVPVGKVSWKVKPLELTADRKFTKEQMLEVIGDVKNEASVRIEAALRVSFINHCATRTPVLLTSLHLGKDVCLLHLPAESFVEYQLFAQQQAPGSFVATAAYSDTGTEYIPLEKSYDEGGYEPTWAFALPETEKAMKDIIIELLTIP